MIGNDALRLHPAPPAALIHRTAARNAARKAGHKTACNAACKAGHKTACNAACKAGHKIAHKTARETDHKTGYKIAHKTGHPLARVARAAARRLVRADSPR
ncbi:hypothetical protein [Paraburkholderia caffeinilytica]|uniref:Uncharacterized protein n=1 Tax=Paraburkholderia caffeinilytica TaxID=1761016 RepID=A0ABQ1LMP9_9BURK|nr:hypothetical protein [Paraburkholderia caffeinilytica]GGC24858.1 hypothetical protein GCM10011400_09120 [Paraburkholderia caffeinilytica]